MSQPQLEYSDMKNITKNPKDAVQLLNKVYGIARTNFEGGTPERLAIVILLNEIHEDLCDGRQSDCARCAEFVQSGRF